MTEHIWKCEDSVEIMPSLAHHFVHLVLTDPPYDLQEKEKKHIHKHLLSFSKGLTIVFSPPENQWILPADQYLFWIKPISTKNTSRRYSRFVEMIFLYGQGTWNCDRHWSQYTNVFVDLVDNAKIHPYRKPPSLIERLILNHTNPGDWVFDPFAGSGVVEDCCRKLGRNSFSMEKNPVYKR